MKKVFFAIFLWLFLQADAYAARGFNSTLGNSSADAISTGNTTALTTQSTVAAWITTRASVTLNIIEFRSNQEYWAMHSALGSMAFLRNFSTTGGQWTFPISGSTTAWQHVAVTYDGSSTANNPIAYNNGVSQTVTRVVAPVGTYSGSTATMYVGNTAPSGGFCFDGKIAEFAIWSAVLTQNEITALSQGMSPLLIRPDSLVEYTPLYGYQSGEQDWGPNHRTTSLTGTKFQPHPPVQAYPYR